MTEIGFRRFWGESTATPHNLLAGTVPTLDVTYGGEGFYWYGSAPNLDSNQHISDGLYGPSDGFPIASAGVFGGGGWGQMVWTWDLGETFHITRACIGQSGAYSSAPAWFGWNASEGWVVTVELQSSQDGISWNTEVQTIQWVTSQTQTISASARYWRLFYYTRSPGLSYYSTWSMYEMFLDGAPLVSSAVQEGWGQEVLLAEGSFHTTGPASKGTLTVFDQDGRLMIEHVDWDYADHTGQNFTVLRDGVTSVIAAYRVTSAVIRPRYGTRRIQNPSVYADRIRLNDIKGV